MQYCNTIGEMEKVVEILDENLEIQKVCYFNVCLVSHHFVGLTLDI